MSISRPSFRVFSALRTGGCGASTADRQAVVGWALVWGSIGALLFFCIYGLLARGEEPLGTFLASCAGGAVGVWVCSYWMNGLPAGKFARKLILLAYFSRIGVGLLLYLLVQDPNYFSGNGGVVADTSEYEFTFEKAKFAADNIKYNNRWGSADVYQVEHDKNANIHTWQGWFFAFGDSRHSLDLAPFNAFHHALAGILICSIGLSLSYTPRISILAGLYTAWIPWAFPASIMWRDSVGLGWMIVALSLLMAGKRFGIWGVLLACMPAAFLFHSNRIPYVFLPIVFLFIYFLDKQNLCIKLKKMSLKNKMLAFLYAFILFLVVVFLKNIFLVIYDDFVGNIISRMVNIPLLFVRAIMGPFPWFSGEGGFYYSIFDYSFHVFQLGLILTIIRYVKYIFSEIDVLFIFGFLIWLMGVIAPGVHTAYLAVGLPFMLPKILSIKSIVAVNVIYSFCFFVVLNCLYVLGGLHGSGIIMNITGY